MRGPSTREAPRRALSFRNCLTNFDSEDELPRSYVGEFPTRPRFTESMLVGDNGLVKTLDEIDGPFASLHQQAAMLAEPGNERETSEVSGARELRMPWM